MDKISLTDKMKIIEKKMDFKLEINKPFVIRLDGKNFSKMVKRWKCSKPFDNVFHNVMIKVCEKLFDEISIAKVIWTGSDEISILCLNLNNEDLWYSNRINKILSLCGAIASTTFNLSMLKECDDKMKEDKYNIEKNPAYFDAKIFQFDNLVDACANIIYRQNDGVTNSISMYADIFYNYKELHKKNSLEKIELMKNKNFNWNSDEIPIWTKYGTFLTKINIINKIKSNDDKINDTYIRSKVVTIEQKVVKPIEIIKMINSDKLEIYQKYTNDESF